MRSPFCLQSPASGLPLRVSVAGAILPEPWGGIRHREERGVFAHDRPGEGCGGVCGGKDMINVPLEQIDKAVIEEFIANQVQEGKTLEYKEKLPRGAEGDIKEFLADVSSFGNASGGDIIYGIRAERGENGDSGQ